MVLFIQVYIKHWLLYIWEIQHKIDLINDYLNQMLYYRSVVVPMKRVNTVKVTHKKLQNKYNMYFIDSNKQW